MRLISKITHCGTGNSVANYTEEVYECEYCNGEGFIGENEDCPKCDGEGKITKRY